MLRRLRVAHTCSHKKQGYLHSGANAEGEGKSPEEYRATHAKCAPLPFVERRSENFKIHCTSSGAADTEMPSAHASVHQWPVNGGSLLR